MSASLLHLPIRPEWLATRAESALDATRPIIDAHHHLYDRPGVRYLLDEYLTDLQSGHNVRASVYLQARSMLRADVPAVLQPIGETEFANGIAAMSASGLYGDARVCAGIVPFADLTLGDGVRKVLERHISAAGGNVADGGRLCGIRQILSWDADCRLLNPAYPTSEAMSASQEFRTGFAHLETLGLTFDSWAFFHQLSRVATLARTFPGTNIVLNHCGGIVRIADYSKRREEVFDTWRQGIVEISKSPNVFVKLSGLGMRLGGFGFEEREVAPSSEELAEVWRPWIETCIEAFGANRCMYASNFPVDKGSFSFSTGLNALKRLAQSASNDDKDDIFWRTAKRFYRLPDLSFAAR